MAAGTKGLVWTAGRMTAERCGLGALGLVLATTGCRSGPPPSLVDLGDAAFAEGEYRQADDLYQRALHADPNATGALLGRARVAVARRPRRASRRSSRTPPARCSWSSGATA